MRDAPGHTWQQDQPRSAGTAAGTAVEWRLLASGDQVTAQGAVALIAAWGQQAIRAGSLTFKGRVAGDRSVSWSGAGDTLADKDSPSKEREQ